jgi:hypothetical protein
MGEPGSRSCGCHHRVKPVKRTRGTETSQYPEEEKSTTTGGASRSEITRVAASETVRSLNHAPCGRGVVGATDGSSEATRSPLERGPEDGERPVGEGEGFELAEFLSSARYEEPGVKLGGPPSKAEDSRVTDSGQVP